MANNQNQEAKKDSLAIQAGGNITIGVTFSEIERIFELLFLENFPKLEKIARQTAHDNVISLLNQFETKFKENYDKISIEKYQDPNIQYSLNQAVQISARKGNQIDIDILSSLLIEQVKSETNNLLIIVCDEALNIIPKLTNKQINFLSYHFYIRYKVDSSIKGIIDFEKKVFPVYDFLSSGINISESNIEHLLGIGALSNLSGIRGGTYGFVFDNYYDIFKSRFNKESMYDNEHDLESAMNDISPSFKKMLDSFESTRACNYKLTTTGKLIALINLKRLFPSLDYRDWIN